MEKGQVQVIKTAELNPAEFPLLDLIRPEMHLQRSGESKIEVWDQLRKKWLVLSPEEWVRQHVLHWLLHQTGYPAGLLSSERGVSGLQAGRTDVLGFDRKAAPLLLVECKAATIGIGPAVVLQAMKYNSMLKARFIWLSNGKSHKVIELDRDMKLKQELPMLPSFEEMLAAVSGRQVK